MRLNLRRGRRVKLRTRVLAGVLTVTLAALVGFDFAAVTGLRGYMMSQTDARLQEVLALYQPSRPMPHQAVNPRTVEFPQRIVCPGSKVVKTCARPGVLGPAARFALPAALAPFLVGIASGRGYTLLIKAGERLSPRLPADLRALAASHHGQTVTSTDGHTPVRLLARSFPGTGIVFAFTSLDDLNSTVGRLELILIIGSVAAGLLAAGGAAWVMRRGLRPVETMAGQADVITAGDLTLRVSPYDGRTEVGRLGAALNGMLGRIQGFVTEREASQEATRRFFTDASHELRTPLASLRANAELYLQGALPERAQIDEAMRRIAAEARRMGVLVDDMLRLARLDQHPEHRRDHLDVTALAGECVQRARTAHPEWTWQARIAPGLASVGDDELLRRAIDNLLVNVAAHTPSGSTATVTAARSCGTITVVVSDDGPGVAEDQLPVIFDRFYRAGAPSARPGSGLGLAIVAAAAAAHYGSVTAARNDPHGLRVTVTLPATEPDATEPGGARSATAEPATAEPGAGEPDQAEVPAIT